MNFSCSVLSVIEVWTEGGVKIKVTQIHLGWKLRWPWEINTLHLKETNANNSNFPHYCFSLILNYSPLFPGCCHGTSVRVLFNQISRPTLGSSHHIWSLIHSPQTRGHLDELRHAQTESKGQTTETKPAPHDLKVNVCTHHVSERVKKYDSTTVGQHAACIPTGMPPLCHRAPGGSTRERTEKGGEGSRDILTSSLVPINSLTTHASCSSQACGKVTQTKEALWERERENEMTSGAANIDAAQAATKHWLCFWFTSQWVWLDGWTPLMYLKLH